MERTDRVIDDVTDVNLLALDLDLLVLAEHEPAAVGEEEATLGIVRVCVGLRVLVVHAVVAHPLYDVILQWRQNACLRHDYHSSYCVRIKTCGCDVIILYECVVRRDT